MHRLKQLMACAETHCADESLFFGKVVGMARDGPDKLQVLSDFDMTLTPFYVNGKKGYTSHGIIESSTLLPEEYRQKAKALKDKYYPIEVSHEMSKEDKVKSMVEWWHCAHALLLEYKLRQDQLKEMVKDANVVLREGYDEFLFALERHNIPLTIFSAGLHDTIQCILDDHCVHGPNVTVFSNKMIFTENGMLAGFSDPLVHSYNKGTVAVSKEDMKKSRTNIILLGDSTGDPAMVAGMEEVEDVTTIKIGYLNYKEDVFLPTYLQLYDVVLTGDKGLEFPLATVQAVLQGSMYTNGELNTQTTDSD